VGLEGRAVGAIRATGCDRCYYEHSKQRKSESNTGSRNNPSSSEFPSHVTGVRSHRLSVSLN